MFWLRNKKIETLKQNESAQVKINKKIQKKFLTHNFNNTFWVLKRTVSL